jgi:hypothetical protein
MAGRPLSEKIAEIRRWHVARKWKREGYHWFIDRGGEEGAGRPFWMQGAGVYRHNRNNIHICVLGGHGGQADGKFSDNFTPEQEKALIARIKALQEQFGIPDSEVKGHNNYAATSCPGCDIPTWWAEVNKPQPIPNRKPSTGGKPSGGLGALIAKLIEAIFGAFKR